MRAIAINPMSVNYILCFIFVFLVDTVVVSLPTHPNDIQAMLAIRDSFSSRPVGFWNESDDPCNGKNPHTHKWTCRRRSFFVDLQTTIITSSIDHRMGYDRMCRTIGQFQPCVYYVGKKNSTRLANPSSRLPSSLLLIETYRTIQMPLKSLELFQQRLDF
jgi:hypothetical protein